ncbi:MAG: hypothetical protein FDX21_05655 [Chlorobium sp.]|nr:MAG: hypothetical protein FDX21_05655 [Chlorobium sp.]
MKMLTIIALVVSMLAGAEANAEIFVLTQNAITDTNPSLSNPYTTGQVVAQNIIASGIGRGSGITSNAGADRYSAKGWTLAAIPDGTDYFTFTLSANPGYELNFSSFVYTGQSSASGPNSFAFRSSVDAFTADIGSPVATGSIINLSAAEYQHLTDPVEFRLYGYSATGAAGTFSVNDYTFNGNTAPTPEPQTWVLFGIGSSLMLWNLLRKRWRIEL